MNWKEKLGIVKLKHSVPWKPLLSMPLMRRDKLFYGNCSSNVKPDSLASTQMETLLLALRGWIVKAPAWVYSSESCQMLHTALFSHRRRLAAKESILVAHYSFVLFCFLQGKLQLSVSSFVGGIIRQNKATWAQEQLSPSAWLWRDGHLSPSASTRLHCSFTHYLNKDFMRGHSSYSAT